MVALPPGRTLLARGKILGKDYWDKSGKRCVRDILSWHRGDGNAVSGLTLLAPSGA
jgi:hypothetical protein